jgi:hypothetical protein
MQIPILIESLECGRFRARAGEPFVLAAEGDSCAAATRSLERLVAERLANGAQLGLLTVANGTASIPLPFLADNLYQTDPSFADMQQAIAEFRRAEDDEQQHQEPSAP